MGSLDSCFPAATVSCGSRDVRVAAVHILGRGGQGFPDDRSALSPPGSRIACGGWGPRGAHMRSPPTTRAGRMHRQGDWRARKRRSTLADNADGPGRCAPCDAAPRAGVDQGKFLRATNELGAKVIVSEANAGALFIAAYRCRRARCHG